MSIGEVSLRPFEATGGPGPGPTQPDPNQAPDPNLQPPARQPIPRPVQPDFVVAPRNATVTFGDDGKIKTVNGHPDAVARIVNNLSTPASPDPAQQPNLPPQPAARWPLLPPRPDRVPGPTIGQRMSAAWAEAQRARRERQRANAQRIQQNMRGRGRVEGAVGMLVLGALVFGGAVAKANADNAVSPILLAPNKCITAPAGTIAVGYDFTIDGKPTSNNQSTATVVEFAHPGNFCAGTRRGSYQLLGDSDFTHLQLVGNNYQDRLKQSGCADGAGCQEVDIVIH